jgi:hypothetical protein
MHSSTILGTGSASVVIVPNAVETIGKALELEPVATVKPSYMLYDLTGGVGSGVFTISDLIQVLAIISTLIFVTIAMSKWYMDWKSRKNGWIDTIVKEPKK